jgi:anaerobic selenocysteine-containing dehydrogenase
VPDEVLNKPLRVRELLATRSGDPARGPTAFLHPDDARARLITDGELAWVYGPRRHELATVHWDERVPKGDVVLRDVVGASPSEMVRVVKPDMDRRGRPPVLA